MRLSRRSRGVPQGMTLIEIMVVLVVIALVSTIIAAAVLPQLKGAQVRKARVDVRQLESAVKLYFVKTGRFPDPAEGLNVLVSARVIERLQKDPWKNPYVLHMRDGEPVVISYGADGAAGGEGDAADISSADPDE
jgi:general secretion pathway protein G